jgi:hypothetical protein
VVRGKVIETEELPSYCAVAMAGLNDLPDTIMTRSVICRMRRRAPDEPVQPWRRRVNGPEAKKLHDRIAIWSASVEAEATGYWPVMPEAIQDRDADIWEALLTVADLAGGHWPETARCSAVALVADAKAGEPSMGVLLLRDIQTVYKLRGRSTLSTAEILADLRGMVEARWATAGRDGNGLDARRLAQRLTKYGVRSKNVRLLGSVVKGYDQEQFVDVWKRYVVAPEPDPG